MNCYIEILSVDRPFDIDVDDNERTILSTNFEIMAVFPNEGLEEDLIQICQSEGVPLVLASQDPNNGNTFIGIAGKLPTTDGPFAEFFAQPGLGNVETHDGSKYEQPGAQVLVRGKPSTAARAMAFQIWAALDGKRNITVNP